MSPEELSNAILALTGERMAKMEAIVMQLAEDTAELTVVVIKGNGEDPIRLRVRDLERAAKVIPTLERRVLDMDGWIVEQKKRSEEAAQSKQFWGRELGKQVLQTVTGSAIVLAGVFFGFKDYLP